MEKTRHTQQRESNLNITKQKQTDRYRGQVVARGNEVGVGGQKGEGD